MSFKNFTFRYFYELVSKNSVFKFLKIMNTDKEI